MGGLLNATCGNAPELILALLALHDDKIEVLKWSLLGSILSNLLLVLGSSLLCGGLFNMGKERAFDRVSICTYIEYKVHDGLLLCVIDLLYTVLELQKQVDVSLSLMFLGLLCHVMTLIYKYNTSYGESMSVSGTELVFSRLCGILMVVAYAGCLFFQLKTHRQLFPAQDEVWLINCLNSLKTQAEVTNEYHTTR